MQRQTALTLDELQTRTDILVMASELANRQTVVRSDILFIETARKNYPCRYADVRISNKALVIVPTGDEGETRIPIDRVTDVVLREETEDTIKITLAAGTPEALDDVVEHIHAEEAEAGMREDGAANSQEPTAHGIMEVSKSTPRPDVVDIIVKEAVMAKKGKQTTQFQDVPVGEYYSEIRNPRKKAAAKVFDWVAEAYTEAGEPADGVPVSVKAVMTDLGSTRKTVTTAIKQLIVDGVIERMNSDAIGEAFRYQVLKSTFSVEVQQEEAAEPEAEAEDGPEYVEMEELEAV